LSNQEKGHLELLEYGRKMLERGDSWRSVRSYLTRKTSNETEVNDIIKTLSIMERDGHITAPKNNWKSKTNKWNLILGFLLMGASVFLFSFLWYSGWLVGLPILLFGAGLVVINGGTPKSVFKR
jgi:hypothetical protein